MKTKRGPGATATDPMLLAPDICFGGHTGLATQADRDTTASPSYEPVVVVHVPPASPLAPDADTCATQVAMGMTLPTVAPPEAGAPAAPVLLSDEDAADAACPSTSVQPTVADAAASAELERFTASVLRQVSTPLAPKPSRQRTPAPPATDKPKRSSRLASTALAKVPAAKRGEVILMRRFELLADNAPVCDSARRAYSNVYQSGLTRSHAEAIKEICPSRRTTSTRGSASIPA